MSSNPENTDQVLGLGYSYVDPTGFGQNAIVYGCAQAVSKLTAQQVVLLCARASRLIDGYCGRTFAGGNISETHPLDWSSRVIKINQPPVITLLAYQIRTAAGLVSPFLVEPVTTDAGSRNVSFGSVYYNYEENTLELSSLAMASTLTAAVVTLGLNRPQVEIQYTNSTGTLHPNLIEATALTAAGLINEAAANAVLPGG